jgi:putative Mn2+ efflux pump MntP
MKRKVFAFIGGILILAGFMFFIEPLRTWVQDPSYTEMEMFLTFWREYLVGGILVIVGARAVFQNIFKD